MLIDDLLKLDDVLRQPRHIPDQHQIRKAGSDVGQDLPTPTRRSNTKRNLSDRADRHNASAITPLLQLPHLPIQILATIRPGIQDGSTRHAVSVRQRHGLCRGSQDLP